MAAVSSWADIQGIDERFKKIANQSEAIDKKVDAAIKIVGKLTSTFEKLSK